MKTHLRKHWFAWLLLILSQLTFPPLQSCLVKAFAADSKLQDLTATTTPAVGDILYIVVDPTGTPLDRKVTVGNLVKLSLLQGLGTGVATFLGTPTSANLAAALTDESGTGFVCMTISCVMTTPNIGAATATSVAVGSSNSSALTALVGSNGGANARFGHTWVGQDVNAGGFWTGSLANSTWLASDNATALHLVTNAIVRQTVFSGGNMAVGSTTDNTNGLFQVAGKVTQYAPITSGTAFSVATCGDTPVGGATAGTFMSTVTGACVAVVTMGGSVASPAGWSCAVNNETTGNLIRKTASTTTTATFTGVTVDNDVISFNCTGY